MACLLGFLYGSLRQSRLSVAPFQLFEVKRLAFVVAQVDCAVCRAKGLVVRQRHDELDAESRVTDGKVEFDKTIVATLPDTDIASSYVKNARGWLNMGWMQWHRCLLRFDFRIRLLARFMPSFTSRFHRNAGLRRY
ncbi:hypothetical protein AYM40_16220 [Paraburkholderia phytofirmans OLGA172]|uniref:Uncharacterized protein n=1 Tax=Paraburkholderia phytofirmans OLGA172 TaxID=1417228 RepID=A0A160FMB1_9BURK|nr:hypothetical protein AYM40_16220 [Paraburkholderia phytofirmans OLGA172]